MQRLHTIICELNKECMMIAEKNKDAEWKNKAALTLIASLSFAIMSILNLYQRSYEMLYTTIGCSVILVADYLISRKRHDTKLMQIVLICSVSVVFTVYVIVGGNDGFAALWLAIIPFLAMLVADMRYGIVMSLYFLVFLVLTFYGPFKRVIKFDYGNMFDYFAAGAPERKIVPLRRISLANHRFALELHRAIVKPCF